ncbi:MAG: ECF transporter S component [Clostridia bacterium]|nr:ECF transporter S component [Clostridia bacterium]
MEKEKRKKLTLQITLAAIFTAIVFVLQFFVGSNIRLFGMFTVSATLVPIVVGAALCGAPVGAWLGLVFGFAVLISGDAAAFLTINPVATIFTVLIKGAAAGLAAGLIFRFIEKKNRTLAVITSAVAAPIVNTGLFLIACFLFFMEPVSAWATGSGYSNVVAYAFLGLAGINFIAELVLNVVLCPVILRVIDAARKSISKA